MAVEPKPVGVRYNDWHLVDLPGPESFVPELPVSVVIPYRDRPEDLALTLAGLEGQAYPRELFEVVVVDDGSKTPFEPDPDSPINLRAVRQRRQRYGLAAARNLGVQSAAFDIVVFLDCDMVAETGFLMEHARWHHHVADAVTIGNMRYVERGWLAPDALRERRGSVADLLAGRPQDESRIRQHLLRTRNLTSRHDDPFRAFFGGNFGVRRDFYDLAGGSDETFDRYGGEDTEFAYRAHVRGALMVPLSGGTVWHQGLWGEDREARARRDVATNFQRAKMAHLIPHEWLRGSVPGRGFRVPMHVVRVTASDAGARRIAGTVDGILADPEYDLVVWLEVPDEVEEAEWLRERYGPDPRVRVGAEESPLDAFPTAAFHLSLPGGVRFRRGVVRGMRRSLGSAVSAAATLADGSRASVARGWALHRVRRTGRPVSSFGAERRLSARRFGLRPPDGPARKAMSMPVLEERLGTDLRHLLKEAGRVRGPVSALRFVRWLVAAGRWRWREYPYWRLRRNVAKKERPRTEPVAVRRTEAATERSLARPHPRTREGAGAPARPVPASVRYNDWHLVDIPGPEAFVPELPLSVVIPYRDRPEDLALALAGLERQTYPRELFEVVVVDDGSETPFEPDPASPINLRVVRQQREGCGISVARNLGVRSAAFDIVMFMDCDMVAEEGVLMEHARWHHFVADAVTIGRRRHVESGWLTPDAIRERHGTVADLLADRPQDETLLRQHLLRTRNLTSRHDDLFRVFFGGNFGVRRDFYDLAGGSDPTFDRYGGEDTEFAYRAYVQGALMVPLSGGPVWHQGLWGEDREARARRDVITNFQRAKMAHLIPHEWLRGSTPGRGFRVPMHVVRVAASDAGARRVAGTVDGILADPEHDLVVWLEVPDEVEEAEWLRERYGPDPRVLVGAEGTPLDAFPTAAFHLTLPGGVRFRRGVVRGMRRSLGSAVSATATFADGSRASITRGWALHRARRTGRAVSSFGAERLLPSRRLGLRPPDGTAWKAMSVPGPAEKLGTDLRHLLKEAGRIRGPASARGFLRWLVAAGRWRWRQYPYWRTRPGAARTDGAGGDVPGSAGRRG